MYIRDSNSLQRSSGQYDEWPEIWIVWDRNHLWYACKFVELCSLLEILTTVCLLPLPSLNWFIYLSLRQSISLLIYLSIDLFFNLSVYLSILFIHIFIYISFDHLIKISLFLSLARCLSFGLSHYKLYYLKN